MGRNKLPQVLKKKPGSMAIFEHEYTSSDDLFLIAAERYRKKRMFHQWTLLKMRDFIKNYYGYKQRF